ncbi:CD48 antigen-like isoform X1 [Strigops habroptila]|uniref:CD48 antigen-like n=1 Tax=Strigops habroptila TaxID=2489341 RepID=A0A672U0Y9_STRHB|nr:CD48 antigen-like isoform X1 [Strigops habroptila]XP_030329891.1 CD48 antigen-like isoform X1 [Strigops habroptila]
MVQAGSRGPGRATAWRRGSPCCSLGLDAESRLVAGLTVAMLFPLFITQAAQARQKPSSEVVGAVHGVAYLSPSLQSTISYHEVHWRRNDTLNLAIRDSSGKVWYRNNSYRGRLELFPNNTLKISRLQKNDSSMYQLYLEDEMGKGLIENVLLTVYELVPKPTVKAKVVMGNPERCEATLECSVGLEGVTYEWISPSQFQWDRVSASELHVSLNTSPDTYTCRVSNPVSSNNASLIYRHPCSWTDESSSATSCTTTSVLVALALQLLLLLALA